MIDSVNNLISIQDTLKNKIINLKKPTIIAVSKTFPIENIFALINHGHEHYGENKVQEAIEKWITIKEDFTNIKLHMIGKLQTNKVKHAVKIFELFYFNPNFLLFITNIYLDKNLKAFINFKLFIRNLLG